MRIKQELEKRGHSGAVYSFPTLLLLYPATQMLAPSNATPVKLVRGAFQYPLTCPSEARNSKTETAPETQIFCPSKAMPYGDVPPVKVPTTLPSLARSFVTVFTPLFATQIFAPSKQMPMGPPPTANVPSTVPSLARSFVTLLFPDS